MTLLLLGLVLISELSNVAGQIFFKRAMSVEGALLVFRRLPGLAAGLAAMTLGFFSYLILLQRFDLSYIYPFESIQRLGLVAAAVVFLKERMTKRLWLGVTLLTVGTVLVSGS
jgi:undecaprenyl phosphate-alpha-L-ara4N flippase subunit ArnE